MNRSNRVAFAIHTLVPTRAVRSVLAVYGDTFLLHACAVFRAPCPLIAIRPIVPSVRVRYARPIHAREPSCTIKPNPTIQGNALVEYTLAVGVNALRPLVTVGSIVIVHSGNAFVVLALKSFPAWVTLVAIQVYTCTVVAQVAGSTGGPLIAVSPSEFCRRGRYEKQS